MRAEAVLLEDATMKSDQSDLYGEQPHTFAERRLALGRIHEFRVGTESV
jgi:hypothetical protein